MGRTIIISNGSKWAGEEPDAVEMLMDKLENHVLDATWEPFVQTPDEIEFIKPEPELEGMHHFSGNFFALSSAFSIYTDDAEVITGLARRIRMNISSEAYLKAKEIRAKQESEQAERYKTVTKLFKVQ